MGSFLGFNLDRWAALFIAILITKIGIVILWNNIKVLLDISLLAEKLDAYEKIILRQPGVLLIKSIRGRSSGSFRFLDVDAGLRAFNVEAAEGITANIEAGLKAYDGTLDMVFVHYTHEFPIVVSLFVPTDESGKRVSEFFGKSTHITSMKYNRETKTCSDLKTEINPYRDEEEHRGIKLAEYIIDKGADTVCCREDLHEKGPGLMFYRFGVDVRRTEEVDMEELLRDYFNRSIPVFPKGKEQAT